MNDPSVDLADRLRAAEAAAPYYQPPPKPTVKPWYTNGIPGDKDVTIRICIDGGMSDEPVRLAPNPPPNDLDHRIDNPHPDQKRWTYWN
jgi:hypothetical protein